MAAIVRRQASAHVQALRISSMLTARWYSMGRPEAKMYEPETIIGLLNEAKVKFFLMGTHGIVGWRSEPRATQDVVILAALKDYDKAVRVMQTAFPELERIDANLMTRFKDHRLGNVVIDIMKPVDDLFKVAFRYSVVVGKTHRVPDLEMALACKFAAMISPRRRQAKKLIDAGDFVDMVEHSQKKINLVKLRRLAEVVYKDGGKEIAAMVSNIKAGREIRV